MFADLCTMFASAGLLWAVANGHASTLLVLVGAGLAVFAVGRVLKLLVEGGGR